MTSIVTAVASTFNEIEEEGRHATPFFPAPTSKRHDRLSKRRQGRDWIQPGLASTAGLAKCIFLLSFGLLAFSVGANSRAFCLEFRRCVAFSRGNNLRTIGVTFHHSLRFAVPISAP